jgi:hypothetical protein
MELDVSAFIKNHDMFDFAHSAAEGGQTAGADTWRAACACDVKFVTDENAQEVIDWLRDFGAWDTEELEEMRECGTLNALLLQFIAGDAREYVADGFDPEFQGGRFYCSTGMDDARAVILNGDNAPSAQFFFYVGC